jgi:nucleoside-diphosphate-sugar epimerase
MAGATAATSFITGADGFIGTELAKELTARGHQVLGFTDSVEGAQRVRRAGAVPVIGNPLEAGRWQDEAAADWVFHLPTHPPCRRRITAESVARTRVAVDSHLLDAVANGSTKRIVYVGDASCYGPTGRRAITEDEPPRPSVSGPRLTLALDRLDGYLVAGLPIVIALPGWVYGNGGWFRERVADRVMTGRRVLQVGTGGAWVSPIHVNDCVRALVHLAERGTAGSRYFLVNNEPVRTHEFAGTFARLANLPLRVWRVPALAARLILGPVLAEYVLGDAVFSNIRLRGNGFSFRYPTLEQGLQQILGARHE